MTPWYATGPVPGPLPDRIDLHVEVPAVAFAALSGTRGGEASSSVWERVVVDRLGLSARAYHRPLEMARRRADAGAIRRG